MRPIPSLLFTLLLFGACSCGRGRAGDSPERTDAAAAAETAIQWPEAPRFSDTLTGESVSIHTLVNRKGMRALLTNYGARMVGCIVPDRHGRPVDIVSGFSTLGGYLRSGEKYYGAIVGRYGNRIAKATFQLEGKTYRLQANNGPNQLHGGPNGFHNRVWKAEQPDSQHVVFTHLSADGEEGYPGNLEVKVAYRLTDENELIIDYAMRTDRRTVANVTNHNFWNLNGEGSGTVNDHLLQVMADLYNPVDSTLIPTGIAPVAGTPFDFTAPRRIGERLGQENIQLKYGNGYDHNFVLKPASDPSGERLAAIVTGDQSGITMTIYTDQPGLQFYGGNFLKGENRLKNGKQDAHRSSFCLETQHFPDSPNRPEFPSVVLEPGRTYTSRTRHRFGVTE
jgi:aldose 1-epimerase